MPWSLLCAAIISMNSALLGAWVSTLPAQSRSARLCLHVPSRCRTACAGHILPSAVLHRSALPFRDITVSLLAGYFRRSLWPALSCILHSRNRCIDRTPQDFWGSGQRWLESPSYLWYRKARKGGERQRENRSWGLRRVIARLLSKST